VPELTELEQRCVLPFYRKMMGLNALYRAVPVDSLGEVARGTADDEVSTLLAGDWRPRVIGAWLACGRTRRLEAALLTSLKTSLGSFTVPPLATAALHGLGTTPGPAPEPPVCSATLGLTLVARIDAVTCSRHALFCHLKRQDAVTIREQRLPA
jgi:hypothetical protein